MRRITTILALLCLSAVCGAQIRWVNPVEAGAEVHGQGWESLCHSYVRLPDEARDSIRKPVWDLSRNSAGLSLVFRSNASEIRVRYKTTSRNYGMFHMPSTGVSGIDLFAVDQDGRERWAAPDFPPSFKDTVSFVYSGLTYPSKRWNSYEYHLYLPLYNGIEWMEIGVPEGADLKFIGRSHEKPIVIYGTSIAQGACASRPGQAWTNMLERRLGHPVVNLGFSGNGKLEPEVFRLLAQIDARMFVIDCMPNNGPDAPIFERLVAGVKILRAVTDCPILLVDHSGNSGEATRKASGSFRKSNEQQRRAFEALCAEGVQGLHYLAYDAVGYGPDEMVEGVHPNDLGMKHTAEAVEKAVRSILHEEESPLFHACVQNRDVYDWRARHEEILSLKEERKPQVVLIGDSITHFWGGDPQYFNRGVDSWDALWKGRRVLNLGFGWDRVENALWRIRHDELDGYEAETVLLLIGTNNIGSTPDEDIVKGICETARAVRQRQPGARIYVCGILPRRGREAQVRSINESLQKAIAGEDATYIDMTPLMVDKEGKLIEKYFSDGLHPNAEGYRQFAKMIKKGMK